jgi:3-oxoacyl-[acyl-carrier protein] reductase
MSNFTNKVVLITGGCSGIGRAAAFLFAEAGANVFLADLSEKIGDETVEALEKTGVQAAFARIDVADFEDVERMITDCIQRFGSIDVLVNSAGILGPRSRTERYPIEDFQQVFNVNVNGVFYGMKAVLPHFLAKKSGVIVNLASVAGVGGFANHIAYAASKHAVVGMTKTAALEYAKHNIRVNAVCPAFTNTPMLENALINDETNYYEALQNAIPMKRFAQPDEIAEAIVYAASPAASFMTGHALIIDGGLTSL